MSVFRLFSLALLLALIPSSAHALDIESWLGRPGVKLVAVEFYATWCKPCMDAVPKWRDLHQKYRRDGLRLIVVSTRDPGGGCVNPAWTPDEVICDDDGRLASRFGADALPAAFLWGWQGDLLVSRGRVEAVEAAVSDWLQQAPRIAIDVAQISRDAGVTKQELLNLVRTHLRNQDKMVIVATQDERKLLASLRRRSFAKAFDASLQCEVGKGLSANSLLRVFVTGKGDQQKLLMNLLDAERGCLVGSSAVSWYPKKATVSMAEATSVLLEQLKTEPRMPGKGPPPDADNLTLSSRSFALEASPLRERDLWVGHYTCRQGRTELRFEITDVEQGTVVGVFAFAYRQNRSQIRGSYRMVGQYRPKSRRLELWPTRWIERPAGHSTVSMIGAISSDHRTYSGKIQGDGCADFTVQRSP